MSDNKGAQHLNEARAELFHSINKAQHPAACPHSRTAYPHSGAQTAVQSENPCGATTIKG